MQARKLVRLLQEMIAKDPSLAYKEICIDTELGKSKNPHFKYFAVSDVEVQQCVWDQESSENESWREVIVIGNY